MIVAHALFLYLLPFLRQVFKCRYSSIWECLNRTSGIRFCAKIFEQLDDYSELDMLQVLTKNYGGHPNLVKLVEVIAEESKLYVVMEMVEGVNLLTRVAQEGAMQEALVKELTRSILSGLCYLHAQSVVHADMQPENVLLTIVDDVVNPPQTMIGDLGSAVNLEVYEPVGSRYGSSLYSAPEVLQGADPYDTQADIWSVGCLVYFMLSGVSPFDGGESESSADIRNKISRAEYNFASHDFDNVSRHAKQFISSMIHVDPSVRMTAAEALEHPWLRLQEEEPSHLNIFRRASLGCERSLSASRDSNSAGTATSVHQRSISPFPSRRPARTKSGKKHHRRLSSLGSLGKGLSKLFFSKEQESQEPMMSSTPVADVGGLYPSSPARSTGALSDLGSPKTSPRKGKKGRKNRYRRQMSET